MEFTTRSTALRTVAGEAMPTAASTALSAGNSGASSGASSTASSGESSGASAGHHDDTLAYRSTDAIGIAEAISMPQQVTDALVRIRASRSVEMYDGSGDGGAIRRLMAGLTEPATRHRSWQELKERLGDDPNGFTMLCCMLEAAGRYALPRYRNLHIPDAIFVDTMGAFSRFVRESLARHHRYCFDRDFWTIRQLSLTLFRLGSLEFEFVQEPDGIAADANGPIIDIHIPSDADLRDEAVDASLQRWNAFTAQHFPQWHDIAKHCTSWMLSPALARLLPESSHILAFQRRFRQTGFDADAPDWREWVFDADPAPVSQLPERTSLQRSMKQFILQGGKVGVASGILVEDAD